MSHRLFTQASTQEFLGDPQTLVLVNGVACEHSCASCFSKVVALIYMLTGNLSKSPQIHAGQCLKLSYLKIFSKLIIIKKWSPIWFAFPWALRILNMNSYTYELCVYIGPMFPLLWVVCLFCLLFLLHWLYFTNWFFKGFSYVLVTKYYLCFCLKNFQHFL